MKILLSLFVLLMSVPFVNAKECPKNVDLKIPPSAKIFKCINDDEWNKNHTLPLRDTYRVIYGIPVKGGGYTCIMKIHEQIFIYSMWGRLKDVRTDNNIVNISCDAELE